MYRQIFDSVCDIAVKAGRDPREITVIAVSKRFSPDEIRAVYQNGCRNFGESYTQEFVTKKERLSDLDIAWHFIGTLQRKKAAHIVDHVTLIHSVDSLKLAEKISSLALSPLPILVQVNTSGEGSKHGVRPEECHDLCHRMMELPNLQPVGLMTMAPLTDDEREIVRCFSLLRSLRDRVRSYNKDFIHLSMGMTHDFPIAIREGATLLRIGSGIFGERT